jgi:hypothetical protein
VTDIVRKSVLEAMYVEMRHSNKLAKSIAEFGESAHMAGILDGSNDADMPRAIAKVTCRDNYCNASCDYMHHAH